MATPTFVALGAASKVASGNMTPGLPAGIATLDVLVLAVAQGDNVAGTAGGTYTQKDALNNGAASRFAFYWSRYVSGDAAPTVTRAAGDTGVARIAAFRGCVTTGDPFVAAGASQANAAQTTANSTVAVPSMTPAAGDLALLLGAAFTSDTSTLLSFSAYTGSPTPTERLDDESGLSTRECGLFIASFTADGSATGARTATTTNANTISTLSVGMTYALAGAADAPVSPAPLIFPLRRYSSAFAPPVLATIPGPVAAAGGTTYQKDASFTAATVLDAPDVAEHAHTATMLAGSNLSQARVAERSRISTVTAGTTLVGAKAVERPRSATATAGTIFAAPDVFTATETAAFTSGARLVAADVFTATDTATFTATSRLVGADVFEATETATFVAGTTMTATAQAGFVAKTTRLIAGTVASAAKAATASRAFTATAGTLLRAVSAIPVSQKTARFTAGTTVAASDAPTFNRTATVIAGTRLVAIRAVETAAPIGHIDGTSSSAGVDDLTGVTHVDAASASAGVDATSNLAGVIE